MDFSKLLQHCRDQHGVKVDTSKLGEMIRFAIFQYFNQEHDKPLLEGELWEILEQLQKADASPVHGSQTKIEPALIQRLRTKAVENIQEGQNKNAAHWGYQQGVLLSNGEAIEICDALENIAETIPDHGTGFRPPWQAIHKDFNFCAIDRTGIIFLYKEYPATDEGLQAWWAKVGVKYTFSIAGLVENWQECIWERPGSREKEGTE